MLVDDLLKKSQNGEPLSKDEIVQMLRYEPDSPESYRIMGEANRISKELTGNRAEVHAQFALNLAPWPCNCAFCSFARINGVFTRETRIAPEEAVARARQFEREGAIAGANLFWAEAGANPRDTREKTEEGPSRFYRGRR